MSVAADRQYSANGQNSADRLPSAQLPLSLALVPPLSFGCVDAHVYRGGFPKPMFAPFLKHLELRTVVSITPDPLPAELTAQIGSHQTVEFVHIAGAAEQKKSKKKRGVPITQEHVAQVLSILNDSKNLPVFLHCLNGRQATSLVIACYRVSHGWSVRSAFAEYARFCDYDRKDIAFVEDFVASQ